MRYLVDLLEWSYSHHILEYPKYVPYYGIYIYNLVGGLEHDYYDFPYIGNVIIPTDELLFFSGVETTNK